MALPLSPNIYHAIVFDLHHKVREFLDGLDQMGQIDHDETKVPHVVSVDSPNASVYRCVFLRNGRPEHFLLHTRRKADAVKSWRDDDGWVRPKPVEAPREDENGKRKERDRRDENAVLPIAKACLSIMEQILPRRR